MLQVINQNNLLSYSLRELPIENVQSFINGFGQQGVKFTCCGEFFSLLQEYDDIGRFELGYYDDTKEFSFQVDRYLTPEQVADKVHEIAIQE